MVIRLVYFRSKNYFPLLIIGLKLNAKQQLTVTTQNLINDNQR